MAQAAAGSRVGRFGWLLAGIAALAIFGWLHSTPWFADPDAFYHGALAQAAWHSQVPSQLPQAWFTELRERFTDHHLLYHYLLSPFVAALGVAAGLKVASALFAAAAAATFYACLRALGVRYAWAPTALLLATSSWLYRLGLVKATPLSVVVLLLGVTMAAKRRWLAVGALSWVYVYLYGGFILLPLVATTFLVVDWLVERRGDHRWWVAASAWVGMLLGLAINPSFPGNLHMYSTQLVSIGVVNYASSIAVGAEWYPSTATWLWSTMWPAMGGFAIALCALLLQPRARRGMSVGLLAVAAASLAFTIKSRRYNDYSAPLCIFAAAAAVAPLVASWGNDLRRWFASLPLRGKRAASAIGIALALGAAAGGGATLQHVRASLEGPFPAAGYVGACAWLNANVPANTLVYNVNWGEWPLLYSCAPQLRYISGLDPTFMYRPYPKLAEQYQEIAFGHLGGPELSRVITQVFGSRYVVATSNNRNTRESLGALPNAEQRYGDASTTIYYLR